MYKTIRGNLNIVGGTVGNCCANNSSQGVPPDGTDWSLFEGLGGGFHCSAGGQGTLSGGCILELNQALSSGGGISLKSATVNLNDAATIRGNHALGDAQGSGNGGGIYVTTSYWEAEGAAMLFNDEGTLRCSSALASITGNQANRWGGGLYVGIPFSPEGHVAGSAAILDGAAVAGNLAGQSILYNGRNLLPSQVATENVKLGYRSPELEFDGTVITGGADLDIGIYQKNSVNFAGSPSYQILAETYVYQP